MFDVDISTEHDEWNKLKTIVMSKCWDLAIISIGIDVKLEEEIGRI